MAKAPVTPKQSGYDVVIVGGAMLGSSLAWWLSDTDGFDGSVLVVERDPTYEWSSTSHTNSCIRQQFSQKINIEVSRFGAEFIRYCSAFIGDDPRVPEIALQSFGYMYLAATDSAAEALGANQQPSLNSASAAGSSNRGLCSKR